MESDDENIAHFPIDIPLFKNKKIKLLPRSYVVLIIYEEGDESFGNSLKAFWCGRKICVPFLR